MTGRMLQPSIRTALSRSRATKICVIKWSVTEVATGWDWRCSSERA
jgi:hypothetical protein